MKKFPSLIKSIAAVSLFIGASLTHAYEDTEAYRFRVCGRIAGEFANYAHQYGKRWEQILTTTAPGSDERRRLIDMYRKQWEKVEDQEFLARRKFEEEARKGGMMESRIELASSILIVSLSLAGLYAMKEPGKTVTFYQRMIEKGCRYGGAN